MPSLTRRFLTSVQPDPAGKDITHWDDNLSGFGLRVQAGGAKSWIIMYRTIDGGRLRKLTIGKANKLSPDEARSEAKLKFAIVEKGGDPASDKAASRGAMKISDLCDLYLKDAKGRVKPSTLAMDKSRIECHVKPLLGNRTASGLTLADIEKFQADVAAGKTAKERKEKGRSGLLTGGRGVAARTVGMLGTILEFAKRRHIITNNPARGVKKFEDGKNKRFLSLDEIKTLGEAMQAALVDEEKPESKTGVAAIRALLLTGCRKNEILALPWEWLDIKGRCLRFGDTKSGAQLRPIGAAAVEHLKSQPKRMLPGDNKGDDDKESLWIFPADRGEGHFIGLPKVLERICKRAKITGVTVHTLRHAFAATAAELGFSELTIAGLIGHTVGSVTGRYAHVADRALLSAADAISARILSALEGNTESAEVLPIKQVQ